MVEVLRKILSLDYTWLFLRYYFLMCFDTLAAVCRLPPIFRAHISGLDNLAV